MSETKLTFPVVIDAIGDVARTYEVRGTPTHFLIDRAGIVRAGGAGGRDWNTPAAHAAVRLLLDAAPLKPMNPPARQSRADPPPDGRSERR